jgi:AAA15 family ATPase/GTPase
MIDEIRRQNCRCIKDLTIKDLTRINVIVGRNATGKTSLLESIFVVEGGNPEIILRVKTWRIGRPILEIKSRPRAFEGLFKDLFFRMDTNKEILLSLFSSGVLKRSLRIYFREASETLTLPLEDIETKDVQRAILAMEWVDSMGAKTETTASISEKGLELKGRILAEKAVFLNSQSVANASENAKRFSELSKIGKEDKVVEAVKQEFPFIERLSVEAHGEEWEIYAKIEKLQEKIPISLVSAGVNKFLGILLAMSEYEGGLLFIDEIENGIYHNRLSSMLKVFHEFCSEQNVQLFVTTHSREFIESMFSIIEANPKDFSLLRTDLINGELKVDQFNGKELLSVIKQGVDIR